MFIKIFVLCICIGLFSRSSYATELEHLNIKNIENANNDYLEIIDESLKDIPQYILDYHKKLNGSVTFSNKNFPGYNKKIAGIYYYNGKNQYNIEIRTDESFYEDMKFSLKLVLPHEIGHFVYDVGFKNNATDTDRKTLQDQFDFWKQYSPSCYSLEETFAERYVTHLKYPDTLTSEMNEMYNNCEKRIEELNKKIMKGN